MSVKVRRILTADINGRSVIASDAPAPEVHDLGGGMVVADVWKVHEAPVDLDKCCDNPESGPLSLVPPQCGNVLRYAVFPPQNEESTSAGDAEKMFDKMSAGHTSKGREEGAKSALMHRTDTLDYGIVLEGEITLLVDDGEVTLGEGSTMPIANGLGWASKLRAISV